MTKLEIYLTYDSVTKLKLFMKTIINVPTNYLTLILLTWKIMWAP